MFWYPTAHSHPCKLTSKMLALSVVENIRVVLKAPQCKDLRCKLERSLAFIPDGKKDVL